MGLGDTKKVSPPSRTETVKPSRGIVGMDVFNRELPPSHCIFEIKDFSVKVAEQVETYQSEIFNAGDCKWSLSLYPNGNKKRGGKDHISLYLNIEETDKFPSGWEVFINYKLFILDQFDDSYLTIQDTQGAVRRFHERKKQWGFAQLLSLETLSDQSNGYLLDDTCIFGAEVFVLKAIIGKSKSSPTTSKLQSDPNNNDKSSTPDDIADGKEKEKSSPSKTDDQAAGNDNEKSSTSTMDDQAFGNDKEKSSSSTTVANDQADGNKVVITPSLPPISKEGLVVYKRDNYPPSHFLLKLDSFSLLGGTVHCSDMFEYGGYNWSLTLHQNGNKEDGGEGYISLYLKLEDQNTLPIRWEVFANFKFFVQDQNKASSYLTIQDAAEFGGAFKRYHEYKNEWGIAKLLSLEAFKQTSNGYLYNDCCVFGVEIFILNLKAPVKNGFLTVGQTLYSPNKITFKLECFSTLDKSQYESVNYQVFESHKWRVIVCPNKSTTSGNNQGVGVGLHLNGYETPEYKNRFVSTFFTLRVLDQIRGKHKEIKYDWFRSTPHYGVKIHTPIIHYGLVTWEELYKAENGFLLNDTLIAQVEFP